MKLKNDFENYLGEVFMKEHPMIYKDDLPDAFNDYEWDIQELIKHGNEFGAELAESILVNCGYEYSKLSTYDRAINDTKDNLMAKYLKE